MLNRKLFLLRAPSEYQHRLIYEFDLPTDALTDQRFVCWMTSLLLASLLLADHRRACLFYWILYYWLLYYWLLYYWLLYY
eukprot:5156702-Pyramimonas_sp.AAC.1